MGLFNRIKEMAKKKKRGTSNKATAKKQTTTTAPEPAVQDFLVIDIPRDARRQVVADGWKFQGIDLLTTDKIVMVQLPGRYARWMALEKRRKVKWTAEQEAIMTRWATLYQTEQ